MNLQAAQNLLMQDRLDWSTPRLNWMPRGTYRIWRSLRAVF